MPKHYDYWNTQSMSERTPPGIAPSIFYKLELCPIRAIVSKVSGKWPMLVLAHLSFGQHRFSELLHGIPDISQRMLTQTLRALEADGLISRHVHASIPPRVDYDLTARGKTLLPLIQNLMQWGLENRKDIEKTREDAQDASDKAA